MKIESVVIGMFQSNAHIVVDDATGDCAIVDTGDSGKGIAAAVKRLGVRPTMVLLTHGHLDHAGGLAEVRRHFPAIPIYLHPKDRPMVERMVDQGRMFGLRMEAAPPVDHDLAEGQVIDLGKGTRFHVIETPGHTPGGVVFYEPHEGVALVGDTLFEGSIGRTDLPGGDAATLNRSLQERLLSLPDPTRCLTGHGGETTIGRERRSNPFLQRGGAALLGLR